MKYFDWVQNILIQVTIYLQEDSTSRGHSTARNPLKREKLNIWVTFG